MLSYILEERPILPAMVPAGVQRRSRGCLVLDFGFRNETERNGNVKGGSKEGVMRAAAYVYRESPKYYKCRDAGPLFIP